MTSDGIIRRRASVFSDGLFGRTLRDKSPGIKLRELGDGLSSVEAKLPALVGPAERESRAPKETLGIQAYWLAAFQYGLDDVGRQEGQAHDTGNIGSGQTFVSGDVGDAVDRPRGEVVESAVRTGQQPAHGKIGFLLGCDAVVRDDKPARPAAAPEARRYPEAVVA